MRLGMQGKQQEEEEKGGHFTWVAGIALRKHH